jgi:hypothetical protein
MLWQPKVTGRPLHHPLAQSLRRQRRRDEGCGPWPDPSAKRAGPPTRTERDCSEHAQGMFLVLGFASDRSAAPQRRLRAQNRRAAVLSNKGSSTLSLSAIKKGPTSGAFSNGGQRGVRSGLRGKQNGPADRFERRTPGAQAKGRNLQVMSATKSANSRTAKSPAARASGAS